MKAFLYSAVLLLVTFAAQANEVPRFDVPAQCEEVASISGGSHQIYNSCVQMEQRSYDNLRDDWSSIAGDIRRSCTEVAGFSGDSYQILESCIQMEQDAAGNREEFSFD